MAYTRMKTCIPKGIFVPNDTDHRLTFLNGAHVWFKTGEKPDNLYGDDVYDAVIDEASRLREESWHAIRSTLTATRGHARLIGNVKGRNNWFYRLARLAETGEDAELDYHKLVCWDAVNAGVLDKSEIESAKKLLPENVFKELYMAEPSDDGGNPFGLDAIQKCVGNLSTLPPVCYGVDLAKSIDWTVIIGLDQMGAVCSFDRFQLPWNDTVNRIKQICHAPTLVDSTGVGDPILEQLQVGASNFEGMKFTSTSKQQMMEGLAVAIQQGQIKFPLGPIATELNSYEYEFSRTGVRYTAPVGLHDDCVCSLALAWRKHSQPIEGMGVFNWYKAQWDEKHGAKNGA